MQNIDRLFILTGLVFLLIGMGLGLKMSATQDFTLHGLHAHLNLLGFVLMTLFGLCYHTWPRMKESVLARVHYFMHTLSIATGFVLLFFVLSDGPTYGPRFGPFMDAIFGITWIGVLLFAFLFLTRAKD